MGQAEPDPTRTVVVEVRGPVGSDGARDLCDRVRALLLADSGQQIVCELQGATDLSVVDVLARLRLVAQQCGGWVRLRSTSQDITALLTLTGLTDAVPEPLEAGG